ncbi:MAG: DNA cytosine methyltransferase [Candidatus Methylumidiphilus sp.]
MRPNGHYPFYEFFAGGGMARLGLGLDWRCVFANDFDAKKVAAYRRNFADAPELHHGDVKHVTISQLPQRATLAWASFPCQDLSLAGYGGGLAGQRSGVFWPFWDLMLALKQEGRNPPIIALENVSGLITSKGGQDLTSLITAFAEADYRVGAVRLDAALFVPQSRPRLFIVAVARGVPVSRDLLGRVPNPNLHPASLQDVVEALPARIKKYWIWWKLPMPVTESPHLADIIEDPPVGVRWHTALETQKLLSMMTVANLNKIREAQAAGTRCIGTLYKRTRDGVQRAEIRFDGVSGCLRTPAGGSSRQTIMVVEGHNIRSRLISPRETARLMGLPEAYVLPEKYNEAYHLTGDGVVVPAVAWVRQHIIGPIAASFHQTQQKLATQEPCLEQ